MKPLLMFLFFLVPPAAFGQLVVARSPGAIPAEFDQYLQKHPETISFLKFLENGYKKNKDQEQSLLQLTEYMTSDISTLLTELQRAERNSPLSTWSLQYIYELTGKTLAQQEHSQHKAALNLSRCKSGLLTHSPLEGNNCKSKVTSLTPVFKQNPHLELILIESQPFGPHSSPLLLENTAYNWTLLSNSHQPIHFYGQFGQLVEQRFALMPLVEGTCDKFQTNNIEISLAMTSKIFFDEKCIVETRTEYQKANAEIQKKATWLYGAGALIIGTIWYALKDKTILINAANSP